MDDASVPDRITDLMVAMAYPKRFAVRRASESRGRLSSAGLPGPVDFGHGYGLFGPWDLFYDPVMLSYAPFGIGYYGGFNPFDYYSGGFVSISPGSSGPDSAEHGRAVNGLGYTRVEPREPAVDRGATGNRTDSSSGPAFTGGSTGVSSGGASPAGYSSGGSSSGGGGGGGSSGTAVPR
jgi:hypothetical protein